GLAVVKLRRVVGGETLHGVERLGTADDDLAHVRDVEQAGRPAHCQMLLDHAAVLDRHLPAGELYQPRVEPLMDGVEGCPSETRRRRHAWRDPSSWMAAPAGPTRAHRNTAPKRGSRIAPALPVMGAGPIFTASRGPSDAGALPHTVLQLSQR